MNSLGATSNNSALPLAQVSRLLSAFANSRAHEAQQGVTQRGSDEQVLISDGLPRHGPARAGKIEKMMISKPYDEARLVIQTVCRMLDQLRRVPPVFLVDSYCLGDDCYVLLDDATQQFCAEINADGGANPGRQWSALLPKMLFDSPERCDEILAAIEEENHFNSALASASV